jgi:hypothetical protein
MQAFREALEAEEALKPGDKVTVRWTNSGWQYESPATIEEKNPKSVRVTLDQDVKGAGYVRYPAGHHITVPLMLAFDRWTAHNCVIIPKKT